MLDPAQKVISSLSVNLIIWLCFPKRTPTFTALKKRENLHCWNLFLSRQADTEITPECCHSHCFTPGWFNSTRNCFILIHNKALEEGTFHLCHWPSDSIKDPTGRAWIRNNIRKQKAFGNNFGRVSNPGEWLPSIYPSLGFFYHWDNRGAEFAHDRATSQHKRQKSNCNSVLKLSKHSTALSTEYKEEILGATEPQKSQSSSNGLSRILSTGKRSTLLLFWWITLKVAGLKTYRI